MDGQLFWAVVVGGLVVLLIWRLLPLIILAPVLVLALLLRAIRWISSPLVWLWYWLVWLTRPLQIVSVKLFKLVAGLD